LNLLVWLEISGLMKRDKLNPKSPQSLSPAGNFQTKVKDLNFWLRRNKEQNFRILEK